jgi:hypothetical protein
MRLSTLLGSQHQIDLNKTQSCSRWNQNGLMKSQSDFPGIVMFLAVGAAVCILVLAFCLGGMAFLFLLLCWGAAALFIMLYVHYIMNRGQYRVIFNVYRMILLFDRISVHQFEMVARDFGKVIK